MKRKIIRHLETAHPTVVPDETVSGKKALLEAIIVRCEEKQERFYADACPLCSDWAQRMNEVHSRDIQIGIKPADSIPYSSGKQFRRHLGRHFEQLALSALYSSELPDEDAEDASDPGNQSDLSDPSDISAEHPESHVAPAITDTDVYKYKVRALYDYVAHENNPEGISFTRGEVLRAKFVDGDWWELLNPETGKFGLIQSVFFELVEDDSYREGPTTLTAVPPAPTYRDNRTLYE